MQDKRQLIPIAGLIVTIVCASCMVLRLEATGQASSAPDCKPSGALVRLQGVPEASGLAASRRTPGRFWTHNDSGEATLVAVDAQGAITGQVRVAGVKIEDLEAIQSGPCPEGACLYLADIGDNDGERARIAIYRIVEPEKPGGTVKVAAVFHATYPDGPRDAEALLVAPDGALAIVTKGATALYRLPREARPGSTVRLERVSAAPQAKGSADAVDVTDGDVSRDGRWVALRSNQRITFYPAAEFFAGKWTPAGRVDLAAFAEPQGEGLAFGPNNMLFVAGEGGGKSSPGTFGRLTCSPPGK